MYKLCVFAGTTEGRELAEFLAGQPVQTVVCVATEYGGSLLPGGNLEVLTGRLTREQMQELFARREFDLVVDATHPYAQAVTQNICSACEDTKTPYLRLLRPDGAEAGDGVYVEDAAAAAAYLDQVEGNILLTTGSKELHAFAGIRDFAERAYARVLPMEESLELCRKAGLAPAHILTMQGPFSKEMNLAMLHMTQSKYLVTKASGSTGGFPEKAEAAREAGVRLVCIGRPPQVAGLDWDQTLELLCSRFNLTWRPQVDIVGIGPGGRGQRTLEAEQALENAQCLIGARRMLQSAARPGQAQMEAIAPEAIASCIRSNRRYHRWAVVMSGDTGFFSGTKKLLPLLQDCRVELLPGISSMSYLCARLGVSYEQTLAVSLHGRQRDICGDVRRNRQVFALTGGENGAGQLCQRLCSQGLGDVLVAVGQELGYPAERITRGTAEELAQQVFPSLSAVYVENPKASKPLTWGLPDECFLRRESVPMTKSEVRSVCLSKLRLTEDAVVWDVGAGSGSVSVEMALGAAQVYAIEYRREALELLEENKAHFGLENITIVPGKAPEVCRELPAPTHVFLGGTGGNLEQILTLVLEKNSAARIVATAIALESVAELTRCAGKLGFSHREVVSLTVAKARQAGPYQLMMGQNPIYIFTMEGGGVCTP